MPGRCCEVAPAIHKLKESIVEDLICSAKKRGRDLTIDTLKIAGKDPVRDVIVLVPKDAVKKIQGRPVFKMSYNLNNVGYMSSRDFENAAYFNEKVVAKQQSLSLGPNETQHIEDTVTLDIHDGNFLVRIDVFSRIQEDDETNNDITCDLLFKGFGKSDSDAPQLHLELLRISGRPPLRGRLKLGKKDAVGAKKDRYAFQLEYVMRNYGNKDAVGFDNFFTIDGKRFFRQPDLSLKAGESRLVEIPVYFPIRNGKFAIRADGSDKYPKGQGCCRSLEAHIMFQGF